MENNDKIMLQNIKEKQITARSGWVFLIGYLAAIVLLIVVGIIISVNEIFAGGAPIGAISAMILFLLMSSGLRVIQPNEALVLVLFGKYYGTLSKPGFYYVNPFTSKKKISLKARTLNNEKQKVNDEDGNPIEIGVVVVWRVSDTAAASFAVENYISFISTQTDSAIRNVARQYPYDVSSSGNEWSLRGSSEEVSLVLKKELQQRIEIAGIEIMEARISHLAYAQEIAAAMLQRQQASAIIAARQMIVEGAVGMVQMALEMINEKEVCKLDDDKKAQMVSNLLVVLCGDKSTQPVINTSNL